MGLQEQIAEAILVTFDELGGDPNSAITGARRHRTVEDWVQQETTKIAFAGGAELLIPGIQLLTIPAGISYLLHKMAHISWGIGALKGAYIVETRQHSDLHNILTLWANDDYYNAHLLAHLAIDAEAFAHIHTPEGHEALQAGLATDDKTDAVIIKTLALMEHLRASWVGDERAVRMMRQILGQKRTDALQASVDVRFSEEDASKPPLTLDTRMSARLATRLATRISARVPARLVMGFIPLGGAVLNAMFNAQTLRSMASIAEKYYDNALTSEEIANLSHDNA